MYTKVLMNTVTFKFLPFLVVKRQKQQGKILGDLKNFHLGEIRFSKNHFNASCITKKRPLSFYMNLLYIFKLSPNH